MRNWMKIGVIGAAMGIAASGAIGAAEAGAENAALEYYRTWAAMGEELTYAFYLTDNDFFKLTEDGRKLLIESEDSVAQLMDASEAEEVDWGIRYEDGFGALMPHLGHLRSSARMLAYDALRCGELGDGDGIAERLAAVYMVAQHASGDELLISSLVGMAIANLANEHVGYHIDNGLLTADHASELLSAIGDAEREDRFGERDALVGEWRIISEYILRTARGDRAGNELLKKLQMDDGSAAAKAVSEMNQQELVMELGGFALYHSDILSAWDAKDRDEVVLIEDRIKKSDIYGPLARIIGVNVLRVYDAHVKQNEDTRALVERLEAIKD